MIRRSWLHKDTVDSHDRRRTDSVRDRKLSDKVSEDFVLAGTSRSLIKPVFAKLSLQRN